LYKRENIDVDKKGKIVNFEEVFIDLTDL